MSQFRTDHVIDKRFLDEVAELSLLLKQRILLVPQDCDELLDLSHLLSPELDLVLSQHWFSHVFQGLLLHLQVSSHTGVTRLLSFLLKCNNGW